MADFKRQGGVLTGREERFDFFEGEPRSIGGNVGSTENTTATGGAAGDRKTASIGPQSGDAPQTQSANVTQQGQSAVAQPSQAASESVPSSDFDYGFAC